MIRINKLKNMNALSARKKTMDFLLVTFRYVLLITLGFMIIKPIWSTVKLSFTAQDVLAQKNSVWLPSKMSLLSVKEAMLILNYWKALGYSLLNTAIIAFLQTFCAALTAYSFARLKFKGSNLLFGLVIFTIIVPPSSIMLAQYISFRNFDIFGIFTLIIGHPLNLLNKPAAMYILSATGMGVKGGLYIYILRQSFRQFPIAVEEAAYVDGAGFLKTFFKVVLPGVSSSLLTVYVLSYIWNYADKHYMAMLNANPLQLRIRLVSIQGSMKLTLQAIEKKVPAEYIFNAESPHVQTAVASACALLVIVPLLIMYMFVQKKFVQGVERSGLGGD